MVESNYEIRILKRRFRVLQSTENVFAYLVDSFHWLCNWNHQMYAHTCRRLCFAQTVTLPTQAQHNEKAVAIDVIYSISYRWHNSNTQELSALFRNETPLPAPSLPMLTTGQRESKCCFLHQSAALMGQSRVIPHACIFDTCTFFRL